MQVNLNYYCKLCDKTTKFKSKNKHRKSFTHIKLDNCIQRNHATENHDFIHIINDMVGYLSDIRYDYNSFINFKNIENEDIKIFIKYLQLSV